ncbi:MAG TPA: hypothetical protein ENN79_04155 [Desulfobacteraceae bacterium]|nr:hypothetical protein [Desulfobacteraceae bacterium]
MDIRKQLLIGILLIGLVAGLSAVGTRAEIKGKSGGNWIISKGAAHGVKTGMTGYFWTHVRSGEKEYPCLF